MVNEKPYKIGVALLIAWMLLTTTVLACDNNATHNKNWCPNEEEQSTHGNTSRSLQRISSSSGNHRRMSWIVDTETLTQEGLCVQAHYAQIMPFYEEYTEKKSVFCVTEYNLKSTTGWSRYGMIMMMIP